MENKPSTDRARQRLSKHLEQINLYAAGIDIGSESHYVAVPEGLDDEPVRCFSCNSSFGVQNSRNQVESTIHSYSKRRVTASS